MKINMKGKQSVSDILMRLANYIDMTHKDLLELKKRMKKEDCSFTRLAGCYVNSLKEKVVRLDETFLNIDSEEMFKYIEIAKKTLSGTLGNNILELKYKSADEEPGSMHQFLMGLNESGLKNPELCDTFFDHVIEHYDYPGNYLILLFHDVYDVITKTSDNLKLDESEESYSYTICAVCPVIKSKAGLGYLEKSNTIGSRFRDWIVEAPETGFLFPAFSDRSCDIHHVGYYAKNALDIHPEFIDNILGCESTRTMTETRKAFTAIAKRAFASEGDKAEDMIIGIQEGLDDMVQDHEIEAGYVNETGKTVSEVEPLKVDKEEIRQLAINAGISEPAADELKKAFAEEFGSEPIKADAILDSKLVKQNAPRKKEKELTKQIVELKEQLKTEQSDFDVILNVNPDKLRKIETKIIDDRKYIVIPLDEDDNVKVNGVETLM